MPHLEIAVLSNTFCDISPDSVIQLSPIVISWCDFLTLFYNCNQTHFVVSPSNIFNQCIAFSSQQYENVYNKQTKYNLAEQVRSAWAVKCETMASNIPIKQGILLNKETFGIRSLATACSLTALSLDEAINTLLDNGEIVAGAYNTEAVVQFIVAYKYYFKPLNTCVQVNFAYLTKIPCYKNVHYHPDCPPYYYYYYNYYYSDHCLTREKVDFSKEDEVFDYLKDHDFLLDDCESILSSEPGGGSYDSSKW